MAMGASREKPPTLWSAGLAAATTRARKRKSPRARSLMARRRTGRTSSRVAESSSRKRMARSPAAKSSRIQGKGFTSTSPSTTTGHPPKSVRSRVAPTTVTTLYPRCRPRASRVAVLPVPGAPQRRTGVSATRAA